MPVHQSGWKRSLCYGPLIGSRVLEVEPAGQCGHVAIRSGQTVSEAENLRHQCVKPSEAERIVASINRKPEVTCSLLFAALVGMCRLITGKHRNGHWRGADRPAGSGVPRISGLGGA